MPARHVTDARPTRDGCPPDTPWRKGLVSCEAPPAEHEDSRSYKCLSSPLQPAEYVMSSGSLPGCHLDGRGNTGLFSYY